MNNSIVNLKNYFKEHDGLQRDNRYKVTFFGVSNINGSLGDTEEYFCNNATIGSRAIDAVADNLAGYGMGRAIPRSQKFSGGVLITFPVTNDSHILTFFNNWFNYIYSGSSSAPGGYPGSPFILGYYDSVVAPVSMQIQLLDPNGNINCAYTFLEVYPIETLPMKLDMGSTNSFLTHQVLFNYREFYYQAAATQ